MATPQGKWCKIGTVCSSDVPDPAKENPGALAGATGAKDVQEASQLRGNDTPNARRNAMHSLTLSDTAQIAFQALRALPHDHACDIARVALHDHRFPGETPAMTAAIADAARAYRARRDRRGV